MRSRSRSGSTGSRGVSCRAAILPAVACAILAILVAAGCLPSRPATRVIAGARTEDRAPDGREARETPVTPARIAPVTPVPEPPAVPTGPGMYSARPTDELAADTQKLSALAREGSIVRVERDSHGARATIDLGSRDGVRPGDMVTIGRGGNFIALLRITSVTDAAAEGVLEMESPAHRGAVREGDRAYAKGTAQ